MSGIIGSNTATHFQICRLGQSTVGCEIQLVNRVKSSRTYAAVVYVRIDEGNGLSRVSLLTAKTKVAPVKTVSIPNLELCGAVLLTKLIY